MSTMTLKGAKGEGDFFRLRFWGAVLLVLGALLALGAFPAHAAPLANTSIGNQASASYTDANAVARITVSNSVSTIVQQVGLATMTQSQSKVAAPGQTIAFPHTITNTGNGPDTFTLTLGGTITGSANLAATPVLSNANAFYADNNCDGVADSNSPTNSIGPIAPGAQGCFVAQLTAGTTANASAAIDIFFASAFGGTLTGNPNTDTLTISPNAVINVTKSINISTGPTGTQVVYQLTYRNTGTVSAGNVVLADRLPAGATYIAGSGRWSVISPSALTDATTTYQGSVGNQIIYSSSLGAGARIAAIIQRVDPGVQGVLEFRATMSGAGPIIENSAQWCYKDSGTLGTQQPTGTFQAACTTLQNRATTNFTAAPTLPTTGEVDAVAQTTNPNTSNRVPFTIPAVGATGALVYNSISTGTTDGTAFANITALAAITAPDDNLAVQNTVGQGTVASWSTYVHNTGTGTDTYNIYPPTSGAFVTTISNFPAGTSFLLFRTDGFTPLTDSNNDGVVDTGPVAAGSNYQVKVVAVLPPSIQAGTYNAALTAQSTNTPATTNTVGVRAVVQAAQVDLKTSAGADASATNGGGQTAAGEVGPPSEAIKSTDPGTSVAFTLRVENDGSVADSYDLSFNVTSGAYTTAAAFTTPTQLPSGFTLKIYSTIGNVSTCNTADLGPEVSNTGVIQPAAGKNFCAVAAVPNGASAGSYEIFFRALSPATWDSVTPNFTTSSADVLHARLTVNQVRRVAISPNNAGQGFPGGSVQYCHSVTNSGNTNETGLSVLQAPQSLFSSGWAQYATVYLEGNTTRNCILDGSETATPSTQTLTLGTITAGQSVNFIVVVQVPGAAVAGQSNVNTFTLQQLVGIAPTFTQANATDTTNVVLGQISLVKDQLLDATCLQTFTAGALDALTTYVQTPITTGAVPGACIIYRVRATNVGTQSVTNVAINDVAPPNTIINLAGTPTLATAGDAIAGLTGTVCTATTTGQNVRCQVSPLAGGATTTMYFRVRIDP